MPAAAETPTLTPSTLNRQVRSLLESHFDFVWLEGEVSNFARPSSGHWYFTLKDDDAQVRCAMFRNRNQRLRFTPQHGDLVRLRARVSLYEGRGEFQLIGEFMEPAGAGALQARFEALRDRLRQEGLFDSERKQALPETTGHLAVITSPTGAALQDVLQVLARRNPAIRVTVLASPVQGDGAAEALTRAVRRANKLAEQHAAYAFDAIILARGGGSLEDLWAFNDEQLARAIVDSALPVVTGVGHEVDFTIADFAADGRAPTPSAAAEMLSRDRTSQALALERSRQVLARHLQARLERESLQLRALAARLRHPGQRLRDQAQALDRREMDLMRIMNEHISRERRQLQRNSERLAAASPRTRIDRQAQLLKSKRLTLGSAMERQLARWRLALEGPRNRLQALDPLAVLDRGYAVISDDRGRIIRRADEVQAGQALNARLAAGSIGLRVQDNETGET